MSDLRYFDDVGAHGHILLRDQMATTSSGNHMHVWAVMSEIKVGDRTLKANSLITSSYDGAHEHALTDDGTRTALDGEHRHAVDLFGRTFGTMKDAPHSHETLVTRVGSAGPHQHILEIGGQTLRSLSVSEIVALLDMEDSDEETEDLELRERPSPELGLKLALEKATGRPVYGVKVSAALPGRMLGALDQLVDEADPRLKR
jgi:hypothetical protein